MDQTLEYKLQDFEKALKHLETALQEHLDDTDLVRDAVIQRFEYTFEICFKTVKVFLRNQYGIEEGSPKACFRSLLLTKIFSSEDIETLLRIVDDRNRTVHTYDEKFIETLYANIPGYYHLLKQVFDVIKKEIAH